MLKSVDFLTEEINIWHHHTHFKIENEITFFEKLKIVRFYEYIYGISWNENRLIKNVTGLKNNYIYIYSKLNG